MTEFVEFIKIPNIIKIQEELFEYSKCFEVGNDTTGINFNLRQVSYKLPNLEKWLQNFKIYPTVAKFYFMPPNCELKPHADGTSKAPMLWGINIPVSNYKDSETYFYTCEDNNIENIFRWKVKKGFRKPIDASKLKLANTYTIDKPCIINTNIMHSATNHSNDTRIMLLLRWPLDTKSYEDII